MDRWRSTIRRAILSAGALSVAAATATAQPEAKGTWESGATLKAKKGSAFRLAFAPDGKTLAVATHGLAGARDVPAELKLYDVAGREVKHKLSADDQKTLALSFSADGKSLLALGADGKVRRFEVESGKAQEGFKLDVEAPEGYVWFTADRKKLAVFVREPVKAEGAVPKFQLKTWDVEAGKADDPIDLPRANTPLVQALNLSPDGQMLALKVSYPPGAKPPAGVAAGPRSFLKVWDATGRELATLAKDTDRVAFSPDGQTLAVYTADVARGLSLVSLIELKTGKERPLRMTHRGPVQDLRFSDDGKALATAAADGTVKLWDVAGGKELATLRGHSGWVVGVALAPEGDTLAAVTYPADSTLRLWVRKKPKP
jgi:WD40 repeat protein